MRRISLAAAGSEGRGKGPSATGCRRLLEAGKGEKRVPLEWPERREALLAP